MYLCVSLSVRICLSLALSPYLAHITTLQALQRAMMKGSTVDYAVRLKAILPLAPLSAWLYRTDVDSRASRFPSLLKVSFGV